MRFRDFYLFESNILNTNDIKIFTERMADQARTPGVKQYINVMLPAYLKKQYKKFQKATFADLQQQFTQPPEWAVNGIEKGDLVKIVLDDQLANQVSEVIDFLQSNDTHGINLSRMPFQDAILKARQWHAGMQSQTTNVEYNDASIRLLKTYANGCSWVQLMQPDALDYESTCMGHCVGRGGYDEGVKNGDTKIISFRDQSNDPHVTIEIRENGVNQIKGKQNKIPVEKYRPYILDLLNNVLQNINDGDSYDLDKMDIVRGSKGFGSLLDVAQSIDRSLTDGRLYVVLGPHTEKYKPNVNSISYLTTSEGTSLIKFYTINQHNETFLSDFDIEEKKFDHLKNIRNDMKIVLGNFTIVDDIVKRKLLDKFGFVNEKMESIDTQPEYKLLGQSLLFRVYGEVDNFIDKSPNIHTLLVVDETGHPIIKCNSYGPNSKLINDLEHDTSEWITALPLFLQVLKDNKFKANKGNIVKVLKQAGYIPHNNDWIPITDILQHLTPIMETSNGQWYIMHNGNTILTVNNLPVAGLIFKNHKPGHDDETPILEGVDDDFSTIIEPYVMDVIEFLEGFEFEFVNHYDDEGFLLAYDIFTEEDGDYQKINWNEETNMTTTWYNELGDETKEVNQTQDLGSIIDNDLGISSETYILQNHFFPNYYGNRDYTDEREFNPGDLKPAEDYYDDPVGYMEDLKYNKGKNTQLGKQWKKKTLPGITQETIRVWRS